MYPRAFAYHRAKTLPEAVSLLSRLGSDAKLLAGGQSLIPLMKLRLSAPAHLVDLNFIPGTSYIHGNGSLRFGAMTRHAEIARSPEAARIAILHDTASGIADPQVRNMGTIGGSLAEADPTGDWAPTLLVTGATVKTLGTNGERQIDIADFIQDAFTTALLPAELITEISVPSQAQKSGGAYIALKRCAPVYASASVAVQLTMQDDQLCTEARIAIGALSLMATRMTAAEDLLRGQPITGKAIAAAADAVMQSVEPNADMRGSVEYKRHAVGALTRLALEAALKRARGERVEVTHLYA